VPRLAPLGAATERRGRQGRKRKEGGGEKGRERKGRRERKSLLRFEKNSGYGLVVVVVLLAVMALELVFHYWQ